MGNVLKEMPVEMQNRITSKAHFEWAEGTKDKAAFIAMYEKLSAEKYFMEERMNKEMEAMKDKIIKLQTR